jgi:hypothetical protein
LLVVIVKWENLKLGKKSELNLFSVNKHYRVQKRQPTSGSTQHLTHRQLPNNKPPPSQHNPTAPSQLPLNKHNKPDEHQQPGSGSAELDQTPTEHDLHVHVATATTASSTSGHIVYVLIPIQKPPSKHCGELYKPTTGHIHSAALFYRPQSHGDQSH